MVDSAPSATPVRQDVALRVTIEVPSWEHLARAAEWWSAVGWCAYALGVGAWEWWKGRA